MEITFKQYLVENAKSRAVTKRVADAINKATNSEFDAKTSSKTGSMESALAITTKDSKMPTKVSDVLKQHKIGVGDKETINNDDGSVTLKFFVMEI